MYFKSMSQPSRRERPEVSLEETTAHGCLHAVMDQNGVWDPDCRLQTRR